MIVNFNFEYGICWVRFIGTHLQYENEQFPIGMPDPIEAIKSRIKQMGMKQKGLAEVVEFKSSVSEILNKKRKLTLDVIRKLNTALNIPTEVLIQDY